MKNQRKNERFECAVPVDGKEGSVFGGVQTIDFSKGGLGFVSHKKIPVNKEIPIQLDLTAEGEPVFVMGKVKWVKPINGADHYRIGVSFESVMKGSKSRLNEYFRK